MGQSHHHTLSESPQEMILSWLSISITRRDVSLDRHTVSIQRWVDESKT